MVPPLFNHFLFQNADSALSFLSRRGRRSGRGLHWRTEAGGPTGPLMAGGAVASQTSLRTICGSGRAGGPLSAGDICAHQVTSPAFPSGACIAPGSPVHRAGASPWVFTPFSAPRLLEDWPEQGPSTLLQMDKQRLRGLRDALIHIGACS